MRHRAKTDANQAAVVDALRRIGCSVRSTASIGAGFPDLAVGYRGQNFLLEVKDGAKAPSARKLTDEEKRFALEWRGHYVVVTSANDAIAIVTAWSPEES